MAEQIKFGDRLFLAGEKVIFDYGDKSPRLEARNGKLEIGYDREDAEHEVVILGNLRVQGTTSTVNSEVITLQDAVIEIGKGDDWESGANPIVGIDFHIDADKTVGIKHKMSGVGWAKPEWSLFNFEDYPSWHFDYNDGMSEGDDRLYLTNLAAENFYTYNVEIKGGDIDSTRIGFHTPDVGVFTDLYSTNHETENLTAQVAQLGDFTFNGSVMSVVSNEMEIHSPGGISFYPDADNSLPVPQGGEKIVWLRDGAKLVFEGTVPDDYEVKLQATDITEDRDIVLPDESGTLALQEWVKRELNYVQFQSIIGDGLTTDFTMNFTVAEDWQALIYIDGVLQEPTTAYTITNGEHLSFAGPIPNGSVVNLIRLANNSHTSTVVSADDSQTLNSQPGSFYLDYNNFNNVPTNVAAFTNDAFYITTNDGYATETYVDNAVANLVDSAPGSLDTLNELAAALGDDPDFANTIVNLVGTKAAITYVDAEVLNAKNDAIQIAANDAATKASNAQSTAISTAAVDATAKANTAESNANAYTDNAIANIPAPTGGGYPNFVSSENLSHGSAVGGTTVTATIPSGATIAYIPWTTVNSARNSGPFNVIVNGTSYFVDDMATGGESGSTSGLLEIGLSTGTIILNGTVAAMLGTPVTSLQLYSQHNDSDRGSASVSATVYYDA